MKNRIEEIKSILAGLNYNEYGMPVGIEPEVWVSLTEELESLESKVA